MLNGTLMNIGGNLYTANNPTMARLYGIGGNMPWGSNGNEALQKSNLDLATRMGYVTPYQMQPQPQPAMTNASANPLGTQAFQNKLNRLTINASDALYGGLLGYNPKPIVSPTGNTYNPPNPNGGFRFPFGLLNGMGGQ